MASVSTGAAIGARLDPERRALLADLYAALRDVAAQAGA